MQDLLRVVLSSHLPTVNQFSFAAKIHTAKICPSHSEHFIPPSACCAVHMQALANSRHYQLSKEKGAETAHGREQREAERRDP